MAPPVGRGFNLAALFICFRESLEAVVTVVVMLQFLRKSLPDPRDRPLLSRLRFHVWAGALLGLSVALLTGFVVVLIVHFLRADLFDDDYAELAGAAFELVAVALQSFIAVNFIVFTSVTSSDGMTEKWQRKIEVHLEEAHRNALALPPPDTVPGTLPGSMDTAAGLEEVASAQADGEAQHQFYAKLASRFRFPFAVLAFSVVLREGLESLVYVAGISAGESPESLAAPGLIGICLSVTAGVVIHRFSASIELKPLMAVSIVMMLVLSSALVSEIAGEIEEYVYEEIWDIDDGSTPALWDLTGCCDESRVPLFQVLNALIGWKARPTVATMGFYLLYWIVIAAWISIAQSRQGMLCESLIEEISEEQLQQQHALLPSASLVANDEYSETAPLVLVAEA
ncbi:high-affinity iron permease [Entophlyctis luteolus]|nr:high-affinity iron permease [Entophlyctis luteolus]